MSLSRHQILAVPAAPPVAFHVPEWSGDVYIKVIDGRQRERFERIHGSPDRLDIRATLLCFALCDEKGIPIFQDQDIATINALPAPILLRLYDRALEVNRVTQEQVEELAGNSPAIPSDSSL
jgi:hypothetical protein